METKYLRLHPHPTRKFSSTSDADKHGEKNGDSVQTETLIIVQASPQICHKSALSVAVPLVCLPIRA